MRFGIVGHAHSGKTTIGDFIHKEHRKYYNVPVRRYKFADPLYKILYAINKDKNRLFLQDVSDVVKKYFGDNIFVELCEDKIKDTPNHDLIIIDDVRYINEFNMLKDHNFMLIGVCADIDVRKERARRLGIEFNENHSSEQHIDDLIKKCDYVIENNGDSEKDLVELENIVSQIVYEY